MLHTNHKLIWVPTFILTLCTSFQALAGTGWFVTIINNDREILTVNSAGNDNWYCNDFCGMQKIMPMSTRTFYTEEKATNFNKSGIQGIDMNGVHVEFYQDDHAHSNTETVITNIYKDAAFEGCQYHVAAAASSSHPELTRITALGGSKTFCNGRLGTVWVTIEYKPAQPSSE